MHFSRHERGVHFKRHQFSRVEKLIARRLKKVMMGFHEFLLTSRTQQVSRKIVAAMKYSP